MDHLLIRKPLNNDNIVKYADHIDWAIFCSNGDLRLVNADSLEEVEECLFMDSLAGNVTITAEIANKFKSKMNYGILIRNATYFSEIASDDEVRHLLDIIKPDNFEKYVSISFTQRRMLDRDFFDYVWKVYKDNKLGNGANNPMRLFVILFLSNFERKNNGFRVSKDRKESMRKQGDKLFMSLYKDEKLSKEFKQTLTSAIYNFQNMDQWTLQDGLLPKRSKKIVQDFVQEEKLSSIVAQDMLDVTLKKKK